MNEPALNLKASLPRRLDTLLAEGCSRDAFLKEVSALCAVSPESPWETLALVDQYYRRGKLPGELFLAAKTRIERRVLGFQDAVVFVDRAAQPEPPSAAGPEPAAALLAAAPAAVPAAVAAEPELRMESRAESRTELRLLRAELAQARKQAAVYLERLEDLAWRRAAAEPADTFPAAAATPTGASPGQWPRAAAIALLLWLVAMLAMLPALRRPAGPARIAAPVAVAPAHQVASAAAPKSRLPGQLQWAGERVIVHPGERTALLTVRREGGASGEVGFEWWTAGLGARAGQDYAAHGRQSVVMADGQDSAQLRVPILRNPNRRHTEMFAVYIGRPQGGASIGAPDQTTVFLLPLR